MGAPRRSAPRHGATLRQLRLLTDVPVAGEVDEAAADTAGADATTHGAVCARVVCVTLYGTFCWPASHNSTSGLTVNFVLSQAET